MVDKKVGASRTSFEIRAHGDILHDESLPSTKLNSITLIFHLRLERGEKVLLEQEIQ